MTREQSLPTPLIRRGGPPVAGGRDRLDRRVSAGSPPRYPPTPPAPCPIPRTAPAITRFTFNPLPSTARRATGIAGMSQATTHRTRTSAPTVLGAMSGLAHDNRPLCGRRGRPHTWRYPVSSVLSTQALAVGGFMIMKPGVFVPQG